MVGVISRRLLIREDRENRENARDKTIAKTIALPMHE